MPGFSQNLDWGAHSKEKIRGKDILKATNKKRHINFRVMSIGLIADF